jgi:hypothetical protein
MSGVGIYLTGNLVWSGFEGGGGWERPGLGSRLRLQTVSARGVGLYVVGSQYARSSAWLICLVVFDQ